MSVAAAMAGWMPSSASLAVGAIAVAIGVAVTLAAWLLTSSVGAVPAEDRAYKDPPPLGFRLGWILVQWLGFYIERVLSDAATEKMQVRLRKAGLDYCLSPAQYLAGRLLCAVALAALACWVATSFAAVRSGSTAGADGTGLGIATLLQIGAVALLCGWMYPALWLRDRLAARRRELLKTLPFMLDLITLCVEAGLNLQGAVAQAVAKGPAGVLREELQRVMRDIRAGKARATALRDMAERLREPGVTQFTVAVIQTESLGMNLGPVLRAQADQRRTERFLRAEKLAMEAPVKMLFPLIAFIFPCTFLVLFFPIVMKFLNSGF